MPITLLRTSVHLKGNSNWNLIRMRGPWFNFGPCCDAPCEILHVAPPPPRRSYSIWSCLDDSCNDTLIASECANIRKKRNPKSENFTQRCQGKLWTFQVISEVWSSWQVWLGRWVGGTKWQNIEMVGMPAFQFNVGVWEVVLPEVRAIQQAWFGANCVLCWSTEAYCQAHICISGSTYDVVEEVVSTNVCLECKHQKS